MRIRVAALLLGCVPACAAPPASGVDPVSLFEGRSTGVGELTFLLGRPRAFRVESDGRVAPDGAFRLEQRIVFEDGPPTVRHWIIRDAGPHRYAFSLSDAAGPGIARVEGSRLLLRYPLGRGLTMSQVLQPAADGRSIANRGTVRWLGITIGRLRETISRSPRRPARAARLESRTRRPDVGPMTTATDPRPRPPEKPLPGDCCDSGCAVCVNDAYQVELDDYRARLAAWQARNPAADGDAP